MRRHLSRTLLMVALPLSLAGIALAHQRDDMSTAGRQGFDIGYQDGFSHGRDDSARHESFDYQSADYQRADHGYSPDMGEIDDFRIGYREGYRPGYEDGYSGRPARYQADRFHEQYYGRNECCGNDRYYSQRPVAPYDAGFDVGFRDGTEAARKDIAHGKGFRPTNHDEYSDASHGYNKHLHGDKKSYRIRYRQGFVRGYEEEFQRRS